MIWGARETMGPKAWVILPLLWVACLQPLPCRALEPREVLVLSNLNAARSLELAEYYIRRRGIPEGNLVRLRLTDQEHCSRHEFEDKVALPVRRVLKEKDPERRIRCLVTVYGMPLAVLPPERTEEERRELEDLKARRDSLRRRLKEAGEKAAPGDPLKGELADVEKLISRLQGGDQGASLDSEIALVLKDEYSLSKWVPNPFFLGHQQRYIQDMPDKGEVLMVSRLDGPSPEIVRRIIDDSLKTEKEGLKGRAYFDSRRVRPGGKETDGEISGYEFYDRSIWLAADRIRESGLMEVVTDDKPALFGPGECPEAALYCGWYSLGRYVDAFEWRPGSVGYHIASSECETLKLRGSRVWCKRMLEEGVAATVGPVNEPYVQAFPVPSVFFGFLIDGYWTLAECYALSQPFWSWQMVLIGDPLYRPFMNKGKETGDRE